MTTPRLALSNPAALTFSVGQGGENLIHDVALVQALLGLKRAKNGRMYLRDNHVTGKYDRATAEALMRSAKTRATKPSIGPSSGLAGC